MYTQKDFSHQIRLTTSPIHKNINADQKPDRHYAHATIPWYTGRNTFVFNFSHLTYFPIPIFPMTLRIILLNMRTMPSNRSSNALVCDSVISYISGKVCEGSKSWMYHLYFCILPEVNVLLHFCVGLFTWMSPYSSYSRVSCPCLVFCWWHISDTVIR